MFSVTSFMTVSNFGRTCLFLSVSDKSGVAPANRPPSKSRKSGSEKRPTSDGGREVDVGKPPLAATKKAVQVHGESVDAKADDFIKRFKQQLKLQRLDSLKNFREMLHRGT
ncbi:hypothetical protein HanHA300_Chr03g0073521 [Helianthus annuus]|nr:hypothetical protein HanHA300_Chr03g0073521 [Helianthus annuus]